eukprot:9504180-Pyramimonas_sp.AAC.5
MAGGGGGGGGGKGGGGGGRPGGRAQDCAAHENNVAGTGHRFRALTKEQLQEQVRSDGRPNAALPHTWQCLARPV